MTGYNRYLDTAIRAVRLASGFIIKNLGRVSECDISIKSASDFVTYVDKESERIIIETIKADFPDHTIMAEETLKEDGEHLWIIDPLDGTTNYIHGYPMFSVSVALRYHGEIVIGVIHDPLRDELYTAIKGGGAFLNERPIHVSNVDVLRNSLIATGFPFRKKEMIDQYLKLFKALFNRVSDIRRAGSAALDLAHLACGRCDGFFEIGLSPWDIAGGSLLIKEAGGIITDFGGTDEYLNTGNVVAGTPTLHDEILKEVRDVFRGVIDR
ncbi:MAG: inositol monophosphatase family protein [Thermodesulfovibrionia bacterium]